MSKIFVRQRRHVGEGAGRPRFAVVATHGIDLHLHRVQLRKVELEQIATETGAEIVYLARGEHAHEGERSGHKGRRKNHRRRDQADD